MRLNGILIALAIYVLPIVSFAMPTHQLNVSSYSGNGYSASALHSADYCGSNGYCMSGDTIHRGLSGTLNMVWNSASSSFSEITGSLSNGYGVSVDIMGGTLFTQLSAFGWGDLITNYGTFGFDDLSSFYNGAANNYSDNAFYLWGQNSNYNATWGLDLYGTVTQVPEPASMSLMALGLIGVVATQRKKKQS